MQVDRVTTVSAGHTVIVSPHLDDAVLSLGAWIAGRSENHEDVLVITVFAGDPDSASPSSEWDRLSGFDTAGAAARARRAEDQSACAILGARAKWLPFPCVQYENNHDAALVWDSLQHDLAHAETVLVPGFPLQHPDHRWLADLVTERLDGHERLGTYVEHPYASSAAGSTGTWTRLTSSRRDRARKRRACAEYASQMLLLRGKVRRIAVAERLRGREWIRWT